MKSTMEFFYGERVRSFAPGEHYGVIGIVQAFDLLDGEDVYRVQFPGGRTAWYGRAVLLRHRGRACACCQRLEANPPSQAPSRGRVA